MEAITDTSRMGSMTIKDVPSEVLARFKAWCSMHQKTVKQALIDYMKEQGDTVSIVPKKR